MLIRASQFSSFRTIWNKVFVRSALEARDSRITPATSTFSNSASESLKAAKC